MILSFRNKGLEELFEKGKSKLVNKVLEQRCSRCLDALNEASSLHDLCTPSLKCHRLHGTNPQRFSISVNGPWRITFEWADSGASAVDLEQYH